MQLDNMSATPKQLMQLTSELLERALLELDPLDGMLSDKPVKRFCNVGTAVAAFSKTCRAAARLVCKLHEWDHRT